jgi:hypothetical protein
VITQLLSTTSKRQSRHFASVQPSTIAPGKAARLLVEGTQKAPGAFTYHVVVVTNQKSAPAIKVPVRGYVLAPLFLDAPALDLGRAVSGDEVEGSIPIDLLPGVSVDELNVRIPPGVPLSASCERGVDGHPRLTVAWRGEAPGGGHHYRIEVGTASKSSVMVPIDVSVDVVPALEVFPRSLSISSEEQSHGWERRIRVRKNRANGPSGASEDLHWKWSDPTPERWITVEKVSTFAPQELLLVLRAPESSDIRTDVSTAELQLASDQDRVTLPIMIRNHFNEKAEATQTTPN